jgi:hypothetical protein
MPAFAGMTLTFLSDSLIFNDSGDSSALAGESWVRAWETPRPSSIAIARRKTGVFRRAVAPPSPARATREREKGKRSLPREEPHHDSRGVELDALFVRAAAVPAEPGVSAPLDRPEFDDRLTGRVVQNEVLQRCVIPARAGIQSAGTRGQVWMPASAGMTLTFLSHPPILNESRR